MDVIIPNLQWYLEQSTSKGIFPRCPFATVQNCPRFYQSLSLLGSAGSTKIQRKEDKKLFRKWERSSLWPVTNEQETAIVGPKDNKSFRNFCPEVSFERFGLFAPSLNSYADDIDVDLEHSKLARIKAISDDWRWRWSSIQSQHYSECLVYSVLLGFKKDAQNKDEKQDIVDLKPNVCGIGVNLNALVRKIKGWIKRRMGGNYGFQ